MPLPHAACTEPTRNPAPQSTQLHHVCTPHRAPGALHVPVPQIQLPKCLPFKLVVPPQSQQAKYQHWRICVQDASEALLTSPSNSHHPGPG